MDLPVCRVRQIVRNIGERLEMEHLRSDMLLEWQTKVLASFIAATVPTEKGKENPLAQAAKEIQLVSDKRTEKVRPESKKVPEMTLEEIMEHGSPTAVDENSVGTFERLTRGFRS